MRQSSRRGLLLGCALALLTADICAAQSQAWPQKPVHIVVPFVPGGGVDAFARVLADKLQTRLGSPFIVDNRAGAGGNVGANFVAKSPPDGYTLLLHTNGQAVSPAIFKSLPFDPIEDFVRVAQLATTSTVLVVKLSLIHI